MTPTKKIRYRKPRLAAKRDSSKFCQIVSADGVSEKRRLLEKNGVDAGSLEGE